MGRRRSERKEMGGHGFICLSTCLLCVPGGPSGLLLLLTFKSCQSAQVLA